MSVFSFLFSMIVTFYYRNKSNIYIGKKSIIFYNVKIDVFANSGRVYIGDNVRIGCSSKRYHAGIPFPSKLLLDSKDSTISIGDKTRIWGAYCHASKSIKIGKKCLIASGVNIIDSNGHITDS